MGNLLLVEDNYILLESTKELLEALGHRVDTAASGREAREVIARRGEEIELVLLDLTLPDVTGEELFREMADGHAHLKVLLCTGSQTDDSLRRHPSIRGILAKPFDLRELRQSVDRALAEP